MASHRRRQLVLNSSVRTADGEVFSHTLSLATEPEQLRITSRVIEGGDTRFTLDALWHALDRLVEEGDEAVDNDGGDEAAEAAAWEEEAPSDAIEEKAASRSPEAARRREEAIADEHALEEVEAALRDADSGDDPEWAAELEARAAELRARLQEFEAWEEAEAKGNDDDGGGDGDGGGGRIPQHLPPPLHHAQE